MNRKGQVKLCDFGVSGQLEKSLAKTNIGCQSYMAVSDPSMPCVLFTEIEIDGDTARTDTGRVSEQSGDIHSFIGRVVLGTLYDRDGSGTLSVSARDVCERVRAAHVHCGWRSSGATRALLRNFEALHRALSP